MSTRNPYFKGKYTQGTNSEQDLVADLFTESIQINGVDTLYIPRKLYDEDKVFIEDRFSEYVNQFEIEMYWEDFDGFAGEGDFFSKFGYEARDELTLTVSKSRWEELVRDPANTQGITLQYTDRPGEGDLIYLPLIKSFFEITFVDNEQPFFQLGDLYVYTLKTQRFTYSYENVDVTTDEPYKTPASGQDPFDQSKDLDTIENDFIDFGDKNILAGN